MFQKRTPYRNKKILQAAKGEECLAQFPGCQGGTETTVFCHLNESWAGKGMGQKADDCAGFFGCQHCHDIYDKRKTYNEYSDNFNALDWYRTKDAYILLAYYRTIRRLLDKGILK